MGERLDIPMVLHYVWLGALGGGVFLSLLHLGVPMPAAVLVCVGLGGLVESSIQRIRRR